MADPIAIGLRAAAFAAALAAAGAPIFSWLFGDILDRSSEKVRAIALGTAGAGLVLTIAHAVVEPARLAGDLRGVFDGSLQAVLLASDFGAAIAVRTLGLGLIVGGRLKPGRFGDATALVGTSLTVVSFAFMGHTAADDQRWLLAPLLIAHLIAVAFWFGGLWPLLACTRHENAAVAGAIIQRFSRVAIRLVPMILVAGIAMAGVLLPDLSSLRTPYGLALTAKVSGFAMLMALAAANKWRFGPRVSLGDGSATKALQRSIMAEWLLIVAVVTVTAVMTALFSPE